MQGTDKKQNMYWPALDGLRALAVLLVVLHHLGPFPARPSIPLEILNKTISWGWIGVDCFFVLSGFLITRLLIEERSLRGTISLQKFYMRRALRIWPLYYLTLFVAFIVLPASSPNGHPNLQEWLNYVPRASMPFILFAGNFGIIFDWKWLYEFNKTVSGIGTNMMCAILMPLWSIAVEEQFYLVWPWIMKKSKDLKTLSSMAVGIIIAGIVTTAAILLYLPKNSQEMLYNYYYLNTFCRMLPLMFGSVLAIAHFSAPSKFEQLGKHGAKITALAAILLASLIWCFPPIEKINVVHTLTFLTSATAFSVLLFLSLSWKPLAVFFRCKPLVYVGKRSYAIYLLHITCLWFVRMFICPMLHIKFFTATEWIVTALIGIPLTVISAELSWHLIEKHFLKLRSSLSCIGADAPKPQEPSRIKAPNSV